MSTESEKAPEHVTGLQSDQAEPNLDENSLDGNSPGENSLGEKLNAETAKIPWSELQRFFASGMAIYVDETLDLLSIAAMMSEDNAQEIKQLMSEGKLDVVSDAQALAWFDRDAEVWALVIKPWELVQSVK